MNGETIAILILFNFHCRVQLNDEALVARKKLLLFLMDKIYQTRPPTPSYVAFADELRATMEGAEDDARIMTEYLESMLDLLHVPDGLTKLFNEKLNRIMPSYEPMGMLNATDIFFERRSFFGLYFRRIKLIFDSLDLQARDQLTTSARAWRQGLSRRSDGFSAVDLTSLDLPDARLAAFRDYQMGLLRGDYAMAKDNMERFFDFYAPGADRELHQHTLLHLAAFHVRTESFGAARAALNEAVSLARSANDNECISACESLMLRIQGVGTSTLAAFPASATVSTSERHNISVNDAVWRAGCDLSRGRSAVETLQDLEDSAAPAQPSKDGLAAAEASLQLVQDAKRRVGRDSLRYVIEVAHLWDVLGQSAVADIYQNRIGKDGDKIARSALQEESRIAGICHKAKRLARAGRYDAALSLLVSPATFKAISFDDYTKWHRSLAGILRLRATRRQDEAVLELLAESLPDTASIHDDCDVEDAVDSPSALVELALRFLESGKSSSAEQKFSFRFKAFSRLTAEQAAESLLSKAARRAQGTEPVLALMPTLAALSIAKEMDCTRLILCARVQLAETLGLHLNMSDGARLLMEPDLPNCLSNGDIELRARAQWTYARMLLSCSDEKEPRDLTRVLHWLQRAERDADQAECLGLQTQILYYMVRLHHHLGNGDDTVAVTSRLNQVERRWTRSDKSHDEAHLEQVGQILDVVISVAGYVASGEAASERPVAV
ncbi:hypothetical protein PHSY_004303 [Pseudozyma hubeiensis SY62]|uniref:Anaphase-promoting complex subunit 5 n=1 Tax=Pseudozyma hubeiensis (strain SY62) TaxID=1305764 RepID=R9P5W3_PSEHS|nr:hypothetical protein PHSY_004303 [Pseudozyma hubeiensis SY62]GAC96719.1 hypothetical protein PHSY_004303 [Pseudozyma hubeiensis SY62]